MFNGRRQPSRGDTSRMKSRVSSPDSEALVKFPEPTRQTENSWRRDGTADLPSTADIFGDRQYGS